MAHGLGHRALFKPGLTIPRPICAQPVMKGIRWGLLQNVQASLSLAENLSVLPRAHIMTAEFDPLRDSGKHDGECLKAAGVPTTVSRHAGHNHGSSFLLYPG